MPIKKPAPGRTHKPARSELDAPDGSIFSFRTSALYEDSPTDTGRYGAIKVIGRTPHMVILAALDGVWSQPPTLAQVTACGVLRRRRPSFENTPALAGIDPDGPTFLAELALVGQGELAAVERKYAVRFKDETNIGTSFSTPEILDQDVEAEWRWEHNRAAFAAEQARDAARHEAARQRERGHETRMQNLTWEQLLAEQPFAHWQPPHPPKDFIAQATGRVHQTTANLAALGRPRKRATRKELRELAQWFTQADEQYGAIAAVREDILLVFEELAHAAQHPTLTYEISDWVPW